MAIISPWSSFLSTGDYSDVAVSVGGEKFRLHWFPLLARSQYFRREFQKLSDSCRSMLDNCVSRDECHISVDLTELPGGLTAFRHVTQYCYMESPPLTTYNVLSVLLAAEHLEMNDLLSQNNLIRECDEFLEENVFIRWEHALTVLECSNEAVLELTRGEKVVTACQKVVLDYASSLDDENKISDASQFFQKMVKLPLTFLSRLLRDFTSSNLTFMVLGNFLSKEGHRWLLSQETENEEHLLSKNSTVPLTTGGEPLTLVENKRIFLEWIVLASGFSKDKSKELIRKECEITYVVSLLKFAYEFKLESYTSVLEEALGDQFHILKVEDLQVLELKSVQSIVSYYSEKIRGKNSTIPKDQMLTAGLLLDQYLCWGSSSCETFHHYFQNLVEAFPTETRENCDILYDAIDKYLEKNWDKISDDDCLHLCSFLEPMKISETKAEHAVQNSRMPLKPEFLTALFLAQKKRTSDLEEKMKIAEKKVADSEEKIAVLEESLKSQKIQLEAINAEKPVSLPLSKPSPFLECAPTPPTIETFGKLDNGGTPNPIPIFGTTAPRASFCFSLGTSVPYTASKFTYGKPGEKINRNRPACTPTPSHLSPFG